MLSAKQWLSFLQDIADHTDEIALRYFRSNSLEVAMKPDASPVTEADRAIEAHARNIVWREHPALGILGEEDGESKGSSGTRLIIDPIDATKNFVRGIPIFATLLAIEENDEIVAGLVSAPALQTRWQAAQGQGAFRGDRALRVSSVDSLQDAQLFHGPLYDTSGSFVSRGWAAAFEQAKRTRGFGDFYQHVLVADGAGELAFDPMVKPWDIAPLLILIEEAGGRASSLQGDRSIYEGSLVTSNGLFHDRALALLSGGI